MSSRNSPTFTMHYNSSSQVYQNNHINQYDQENQNYDQQHSFRNPTMLIKVKRFLSDLQFSCSSPRYSIGNEDTDMKKQIKKLTNFFRESCDQDTLKQSLPQTRSQSTQREASVGSDNVAKTQQRFDLNRVDFTKILTAFHTNQLKHMIKPDKCLCLSVKSIITFFVGCDDWLPQEDNFYKKNLSWTELQIYICHPKFHSVLAQASKMIACDRVSRKNYQNSLLILEMCHQIKSQAGSQSSQIQTAIIICVQELLNFYELEKSLENKFRILSPKSQEIKININKPENISITFEIELGSQIQNPSSVTNQSKSNNSDQNYNQAFFEQEKLSPIRRNENSAQGKQVQLDYNNDISFDSMLNISDQRLVSFNKKRPSKEVIQQKKATTLNESKTRLSSITNISHGSKQESASKTQDIIEAKRAIIKKISTRVENQNVISSSQGLNRNRSISEISQRPRFNINTSSSQLNASPKSSSKSLMCQKMRTQESHPSSSQESKNSCQKLIKNSSYHKQNTNPEMIVQSQQKSQKKKLSLFQAKTLDIDTKKSQNQIISEKKVLHQVIEQHKKIINKLQDQESQIKWKIEREAKQLSKLEQDHRIDREITWNRQQTSKQDIFLRQQQDNQKKERHYNYQFRQELREHSTPNESNFQVIQDHSYKNLQYTARKSQDNLKQCEERLYTVQNSIKQSQRSPFQNNKKYLTHQINGNY